jgi:hypothetical protein
LRLFRHLHSAKQQAYVGATHASLLQ